MLHPKHEGRYEAITAVGEHETSILAPVARGWWPRLSVVEPKLAAIRTLNLGREQLMAERDVTDDVVDRYVAGLDNVARRNSGPRPLARPRCCR